MALNTRRSGVLLHPTSLPSPWGIGDLGSRAYEFVDFLNETHQQLWQLLPLGPTGENGSPYSAFSSIAGNPLLISLERLEEDGILSGVPTPEIPEPSRVDFQCVSAVKLHALQVAFEQFQSQAQHHEGFQAFCVEQGEWIDDYSLFMTLKAAFPGRKWNEWPKELTKREPWAIETASRDHEQLVAFHKFTQYVFYQQWRKLKRYAHRSGITIVGDIPFYVAFDSADVWANPENFALDRETGEAMFMAGVPPDYFSETGQLWGNPIYDWRHLEANGFQWWVRRFQKLVELVDIVRIDHFRGFQAYWQVPRGETTAVNGQWVECCGDRFSHTLEHELGHLPVWAEDLGLITPEVEKLRDNFHFPGMEVLQFAFDEQLAENPYLPFNFPRNCVCYTGTHDNNTSLGWWNALDSDQRRQVLQLVDCTDERDIPWSLIRLAMSSIANNVVIPLQDILELSSDARMNVPGQEDGNWAWRYEPNSLTHSTRDRLLQLTEIYGRSPRRIGPNRESALLL